MLEGFKILTVTHRQTSLPDIGKFVAPRTDEAVFLAQLQHLKAAFGLEELVYLATCNRVIFLFYTEKKLPPAFANQFFQLLHPQMEADFITTHAVLLSGKLAADYLFKVAASVDSLVVGEREILRQLREAYDFCLKNGLTGDHLRIIMQYAVAAAKEVYADTRLGEKSVSVVSLAVKELLKTKLPKDARILMIGAGQTNMLLTKFLAKHGYSKVAVFNRTLEKSQELAGMMAQGRAFAFSELPHYAEGFDCLIVCTGATQVVVDKTLYASLLAGETDGKVVIDLSVPNNFCRDAAAGFNVHFIEVEGLRNVARENLACREQEVALACQLLDAQLLAFENAARRRRIELAFGQVPAEMKAVKERALNNVFKKEVQALDADTRLLLEKMMTYMEQKCTGIPMKLAKEALAPA